MMISSPPTPAKHPKTFLQQGPLTREQIYIKPKTTKLQVGP
jgi:hypothetical protein